MFLLWSRIGRVVTNEETVSDDFDVYKKELHLIEKKKKKTENSSGQFIR
jgi:hypothetical protein